MAVTTTYAINKVVNEFTVNNVTNGSQTNSSAAMLEDGSFVVTYDGISTGDYVSSDQYDADGNFIRTDSTVNSTTTNDQKDSEVAGLNNGGYVVVYEDESLGAADGSIRFRLFNDTGGAVGNDVDVGFNGFDEYDPSVATLADGRFVISWTLQNNGHGRIYRAVVNENGTIDASANAASPGSTANNHAFESDVAALADGGYVITWSEDDPNVAGFDSNVRARIYNADNSVRNTITIDPFGTQNRASDVVGMEDGRFAVVYHDNGWGIDGTEITMRIYNADGTASSNFIRVNTTTNNDQSQAKITELSNGFLAVTWTHEFSGTDDDIYGRIFDANGNAITNQFTIETSTGFQSDSDVAALLNGRFVTTYTDAQSNADDGSNGHIGGEIAELVRTSTSDGAGDVINGDSIRDIMHGNAGNDTLRGRGGNDELYGGADNDRIAGGGGDDIINGGAGDGDRVLFSGTVGATVDLAVAGPQNTGYGMDTITGIEEISGTDANDIFFGNSANNTIIARGGNDFVNGREGNDVLQGRQNSDTLLGGDGNDKLRGQSGNDYLAGGLGKDVKAGGAGADIFDFNSTDESGVTGATRDKIKAFDFGSDTIDVSTIDANTLVAGNQAFVLDTGGGFVAGEIRQIDLGAKTLLQFNTDGDAAAEMEIMVLNNPGTFSDTDFNL